MLANAAAMNYGFAFRIATYAALRQIAADVFGGYAGQLVVDSPHNSIYEEEVDGEPAVVHRHNSCRAYPAELMPRRHDLRRDRPGGAAARHPPDVVLPVRGRADRRTASTPPATAPAPSSPTSPRAGLSTEDERQRSTLRFRYNDAAPADTAHLDDNGVNAALGVLVRGGLVRPVARMRPFAVLH